LRRGATRGGCRGREVRLRRRIGQIEAARVWSREGLRHNKFRSKNRIQWRIGELIGCTPIDDAREG
jgi:hypothetical protein